MKAAFVKQPSQEPDRAEAADEERDAGAAGSMTQMKKNGCVQLSACSHL